MKRPDGEMGAREGDFMVRTVYEFCMGPISIHAIVIVFALELIGCVRGGSGGGEIGRRSFAAHGCEIEGVRNTL